MIGGILSLFLATNIVALIVIYITENNREKQKELYRIFKSIKKGDKYINKNISNPFDIKENEIAEIIDKEQSLVDKKYYVLFRQNDKDYSINLKKFLKNWMYIDKNSSIMKTLSNESYKNRQMFINKYNNIYKN